MINRFLLPLSFLLVMTVLLVQPVKSQNNNLEDLLNQYAKSNPDVARVDLLLKLSKFYLLKPYDLAEDLDSALILGKKSKLLSRDLKFKQGEEKADFIIGWIYVEGKNYSALTAQMKMLGDSNKIRVLLRLAEYKWAWEITKEVKDSAIYYAGMALEQARAIGSVILEIKARVNLAQYTGEKSAFESLKPLLIKGFKSCRNAGLLEDLSQTLLDLLFVFGSDDQYYAEIKSIWETTLNDSKSAAETKFLQEVIQEVMEKSAIIGFTSANAYNIQNADKFFFRLIDLFGKKAELSPLIYGSLCYAYFVKGDLTQCIYNGIKAEKLAGSDNLSLLPRETFSYIGQAYFRMGNTDECINYLQKEIALLRRNHKTISGGVLKYLTRAYIAKNKLQEALTLLDELTKNGRYVNEDLKDILESKGMVYQTLGQYEKAEQYYLECVQLARNMSRNRQLINYVALSKLYLQSKQYDKAVPWLDTLATTENKDQEPLYIQEELALIRFKFDSSMGNYQNAIADLQEHRLIHDSIFTEAKNNQVEELKIQYETDKKNKDIQIKTADLQRTILLKNVFIAGAIFLFILLAMIYYRFFKNQRRNRLLLTQQKQLQKLNGQQTKLLEEKNWLVKEIHHRVKNNLQIVMSLLNSQSAYIDNEPALTAIHDSQHRVHAMSLIHQKLYGTENISTIDMSVYIRELASYLADSFDTGQRIHFDFATEPLEMDVSQAIPLGLILNEAITNSLKYAFPDEKEGVIKIILSNATGDQYLLEISDDGIGMPSGLNNKKAGSLGMSLMAGLSEDLDGSFSIENNNGTVIKISFVHLSNVKRYATLTTSLITNN